MEVKDGDCLRFIFNDTLKPRKTDIRTASEIEIQFKDQTKIVKQLNL